MRKEKTRKNEESLSVSLMLMGREFLQLLTFQPRADCTCNAGANRATKRSRYDSTLIMLIMTRRCPQGVELPMTTRMTAGQSLTPSAYTNLATPPDLLCL